MPILNYTTTIPTARTVGEVQSMLAGHGASAVAIRYADRLPVGVSFVLPTAHGDRSFTLPVNIDGVRRLLLAEEKAGKMARGKRGAYTTPEHATKVAWRVVKDWLAAQLAIIDAQMATLDQVMLPYLHVDGEQTLYELYLQREQRAIGGGGSR